MTTPCGVWRHRLIMFLRERDGQPFTARELTERFTLPSRNECMRAHVQLRMMLKRGDVVRLARKPNRYAPVLR